MKILFLLLFVSIIICGQAQQKQLSLDKLTVVNGLPDNYPRTFVQDNKGYMWIGTFAGLVRYDGYNIKTYTLGKDVAKEHHYDVINCLFVDHEGILWVNAGDNGLFHYNNSTDDFTQIKQNALTSISSIYGNCSIKEDNQNNFWILRYAYDDPVYHLDQFNIKTGSYLKFTTGTVAANTIPVHSIFSLLVDKAGKLWINTDNGIYTFDTLSKKFKGYLTSTDSNANTAFNPMYEATSQPGILWMNVGNTKKDVWQGLLHFDTKTGNVKQYRHNVSDPASIASDSFSVIVEDNKTQNLWIGTDKGLSKFDLKTEKFTNYIFRDTGKRANINSIYRIEEDNQGCLWMATNNRLLFFDPHKEIFTKFIPNELTPDGLPDNPVNVIFIDKTYNVWLSFQNRFGLQRIKQQNLQFTQYKNIPGNGESYPGGGVNNFVLAKDSTYFMATAKGLYNWNRNTNQFKKINLFTKSTEDGESINKIQLDKNGMLWGLKNHNDIFSYNIKTGTVKTYQYKEGDSNSLSGDVIYTMFEDTEGTIWAGPKTKILDKLAGKTQTFTHLHFDSNGGFVQAFFEDSKGLLWIGTSEGALYCLNPVTGKLTSYPNPEKEDEPINDIIEDKNGRIWCATFDGIFLFDKNTGKRRIFREKDGLQYHFAGNIIEDKEGYLWITSERGLSRLNPDNFTFSNFTSLQGLPEGLSFSGWTKPFLTGDGELMIGNKTGFFTFFPSSIVSNPVPPFIHIDAIIYTDSKSTGNEKEDTILPDKQYKKELSYNKNRITFNYTGIHFSNAALNQYAYKLKGYNDNWVQAGTQRTVTYNNLPPGTYTFFVKSSNNDGVWNKEPASFTIIINPPWWRTWWAYIIYVVCFIMIAFFANRTIRNRIVEKERMKSREKELEQAKEIEKAYNELKSTQAQLIQSEKMASLGELTAGIAHEIQNPLNFVNNFSEVNQEMIDELQTELKSGNIEEAIALSNDIKDNEEKINHHGKRADAIVKGMLQHSRKSEGKKEPTDINALCDEYLRLSYHGLRAKDKSFNTEIKTDFDESIGKINIVPQDIGRVLLNLFNNAFYAVNEKKKSYELSAMSYEPLVSVQTKRINGKVEIRVADNGNGIPQNIVDKIFQPFFTTKPTGSGTGLGLSLSYDIIKAHGGEIKVETKEGEGSTFIIQIPVA